MNDRLLTALLIAQTLTLGLLAADRLVPVAHADGPHACEITNWPPMFTGSGFQTLRVQVEEVRGTVPVTIRGWQTSDRVSVAP